MTKKYSKPFWIVRETEVSCTYKLSFKKMRMDKYGGWLGYEAWYNSNYFEKNYGLVLKKGEQVRVRLEVIE